MIVSQEFHAVKCNCCGELYEDSEGTYYADESLVEEYAVDNNWIEYQGGHVCPNCYEIGDDDETVLLKPFIPEPEIKHKTDLERFKELFDSVGVEVYLNGNILSIMDDAKCSAEFYFENEKLTDYGFFPKYIE